MDMTVDVFVIIVTYNGAEWISKCLHSLQVSSIDLKIIVVDNQSQDETASIIDESFPNVDLIISDSNIGFGQANNIGIKKALRAGADYIFLLNQDAWIHDDLFKTLIDIHKKNPEYGILAPLQVNKDRTKIDNKFLYYMYTTENILSDICFRREREVYSTEFVNAAAWMLTRDCLKKVGLFDPFFFHYSEDRNFCHRAIYHGFKVGICPKLCVIHDRENRISTSDREEIRKIVFREEVANLLDIRKVDFKKGYKIKRSQKIKLLIKSILKFDFGELKQAYQEFRYLRKKRPSMLKSFKTNRIGGDKYLS